MGEALAITYGLTKLVAYTGVCYAGLRVGGARRARLLVPAVLFGVLRLLMGLFFGVGIFFAATAMFENLRDVPGVSVLTYLAVYVPTRWIEWSLMALLLVPRARSVGGFWLGSGAADRKWRLMGILVSCAADVPVIFAFEGLPMGRIFC